MAYVGKNFIGVTDIVRCLNNDGASLVIEYAVNNAVIVLNRNTVQIVAEIRDLIIATYRTSHY